MLPELILKEENLERYDLLFVTGVVSALIGFVIASLAFPSRIAVFTVIFAALPLVYPLTAKFLQDEEQGKPHSGEVFSYLSLFAGQSLAFLILGVISPDSFSAQMDAIGATGNFIAFDSLFAEILVNNLTVFSITFMAAALIGSAGAFILTWNASVLGVFFSHLLSLHGTSEYVNPILYVPHATFEITGFITAGIAGSLVSAALYREHYSLDTWEDYGLLLGLGVSCVITGAFLETGLLAGFMAGLTAIGVFVYELNTLNDL